MSLGSSAAPAARRTAPGRVASAFGGAARPALLVVGLTLAVSGCAAGQLAQTSLEKSTVDGASGDAGPIALRDIAIAYPDGGRYREGDSGRLEFLAVNSGDQADQLVSIRTGAAQQVAIGLPLASAGTPTATASATTTPPASTPTASGSGPATTTTPSGASTTTAPATAPRGSAPVPLPPEMLTSFWDGGVVVTLVGMTGQLLPAQIVEITFVFDRAGEVTIKVPVAVPPSPLPPPPAVDVNAEPTPSG